jgi:thioredoxin reductase
VTGSPAGAAHASGAVSPAVVDVLVIGGGPAGLSAALNLGRARASVALVDADRPRNAATLLSHGFLTRDGVPPHELRRLARAELEAYPDVVVHGRTKVVAVAHAGEGDADARFIAMLEGRRAPATIAARAVIVATGLRETLPDVPNIRGFYGMSLFSCAACDGWELRDRPLALIGESADLADRARLIARWTNALTVFTNGSDALGVDGEAELTASGIRVERSRIAELRGERGMLSSIVLEDGTRVDVAGGFVRPEWQSALEFLAPLVPDLDEDGHLVTDRSGRSSVPGVYGAGDAAAPGAQQLIVAAGAGARVAAVAVHDALGVTQAH